MTGGIEIGSLMTSLSLAGLIQISNFLEPRDRYCLLTSLGKMFLLGVLFYMKIFYQKPFVFSVSVFCSQIFTLKLNL